MSSATVALPTAPSESGVTTRPRTPADEDLLRCLYATTRADELAAWGWPDAQAALFLDLQYRARERSLPPGSDDRVILVEGRPVGRLVLDRAGEHLRVVDIAVLPGERGAGVGTTLLAEVCAEADATGLPVTLHVLPGNPAARLYARHGFRVIGTDGVHTLMRREPREGA